MKTKNNGPLKSYRDIMRFKKGLFIMVIVNIALAIALVSSTANTTNINQATAALVEEQAAIISEQAAIIEELSNAEIKTSCTTESVPPNTDSVLDIPPGEFIEEDIQPQEEDVDEVDSNEEDELVGEETSVTNYLQGAELQAYMDNHSITLDLQVAEYLVQRAYETGIPFQILFSISFYESRFVTTAYNASGCYGLFQIRYSNFSWLSTALGKTVNATTIYDPYINIDGAITILTNCRDNYSTSNWHIALMRYNAGPAGAESSYFSKGVYQSAYSIKVINNAISYGMTEAEVNIT